MPRIYIRILCVHTPTMHKVIRKSKEALNKQDIINILNSCADIRLKTYVMLLAATVMRATEALSIRIKDIDFKASPVKVFVRGEYTKTKVDRTRTNNARED